MVNLDVVYWIYGRLLFKKGTREIMIDWFMEQTWLIEGLVTMSAALMVATVVYFWIEHFRGD